MKKFFSLVLALCIILSVLCVPGLASGEPIARGETGLTVYAPAAYENGNGVINGYYAATAPIVVTEDGSDADALLDRGYVVAVTDDLTAAVNAIRAGGVPGDADCIILRGGTEAAVVAANSGVYGAQIDDPVVKAKADAEAVAAELAESARDYAMSFAEVTITEAQNTTVIAGEDRPVIEASLPGMELDWTASGEMSGEPSGEASDEAEDASGEEETENYSDVEATVAEMPAEAAVPTDAPAIKVKDAPAYVRIHWDLANTDGSYAAAYGLADSFRDAGSVVQFNYIFDNTASDTEAFCDWVDRICQFERDFSPEEIATTLDLGNSLLTGEAKWTLSGGYYVLSGDRHIGVVDIARPELPDYQGVSVAVPAEYVNGINPDGTLDINWEAEITNVNGMTYTAATAPIVMQTGATGYSVKMNYLAYTGASSGFITVEPGNRGKYSRAVDAEGHTYFTGDAPCCSTDQKSTVRWLRYNHDLGYIPGDIDRIVTWGGSGGGAHATLICAGDSPYYAEYLYKNGALGVDCVKGEYTYLDGFSDAVWGSCPGGAVTNLEEANMLYEFETWLSTPTDEVLLTLDDGTPVYVPQNLSRQSEFYKLLSYYMVMEFVDYYQTEQLSADLDGDGVAEPLTLSYDPAAYPETSGLHGTYVDYFLRSAEAQLEWYLNNIGAAYNNTYLNENGESDAEAFLNGHYTYYSLQMGPEAPVGEQDGIDLYASLVKSAEQDANGKWHVTFTSVGAWEAYRGRNKTPLAFDAMNYCTENEVFGDRDADFRHWDKYCLDALTKHYDELAAVYADSDSRYDSFADLYEDFANDCIEIVLGQGQSGNVTEKNIAAVLDTLAYADGGTVSHDIVWMYNPMNLFLDGTATLPTWVWTVTGGVDSDSSNLVSMNDALALSMNGVDASFAWTWNAGHGSNTPLNTTQNGVIDAMMAKYAE